MKRNPLIFLARLEGFEPPTYGLEVRCSVQLSYRRCGFTANEVVGCKSWKSLTPILAFLQGVLPPSPASNFPTKFVTSLQRCNWLSMITVAGTLIFPLTPS